MLLFCKENVKSSNDFWKKPGCEELMELLKVKTDPRTGAWDLQEAARRSHGMDCGVKQEHRHNGDRQ